MVGREPVGEMLTDGVLVEADKGQVHLTCEILILH